MKQFFLCGIVVLLANGSFIFAQNNLPEKKPAAENQAIVQTASPLENISQETARISKSLQILNKRIKVLLDQFALGKGVQFNERQQKLLLGFEILNRAEQRLVILQKFQIELAEKEAAARNRLGQVEQDVTPENIDRSIAFVGTTKTDEMRENRRRLIESERGTLQNLLSQIRRTLAQTGDELRAAETLVQSLRKKILPQIDLEISDL